jgi:hypothetical protein
VKFEELFLWPNRLQRTLPVETGQIHQMSGSYKTTRREASDEITVARLVENPFGFRTRPGPFSLPPDRERNLQTLCDDYETAFALSKFEDLSDIIRELLVVCADGIPNPRPILEAELLPRGLTFILIREDETADELTEFSLALCHLFVRKSVRLCLEMCRLSIPRILCENYPYFGRESQLLTLEILVVLYGRQESFAQIPFVGPCCKLAIQCLRSDEDPDLRRESAHLLCEIASLPQLAFDPGRERRLRLQLLDSFVLVLRNRPCGADQYAFSGFFSLISWNHEFMWSHPVIWESAVAVLERNEYNAPLYYALYVVTKFYDVLGNDETFQRESHERMLGILITLWARVENIRCELSVRCATVTLLVVRCYRLPESISQLLELNNYRSAPVLME